MQVYLSFVVVNLAPGYILFFFRLSRIILDLGEDDSSSSDSGSSNFESDFEQDQTLDLSPAPTDNEYVNYYLCLFKDYHLLTKLQMEVNM